MPAVKLLLILLANSLFSSISFAQNQRELSFENYDPASTLKVPQHILKSAKYPFIDVHNHQPAMANQDLSIFIDASKFPE